MTKNQDVKDVIVVTECEDTHFDTFYSKLIGERHKDISLVYFPLYPLHYTNLKKCEVSMGTCVHHNIPMLIETRKEIPDWVLKLLSNNPNNEVRFHISTFNYETWRLLFTKEQADSPEELINSIIRCFMSDIKTSICVEPIIPDLISIKDILQLLNMVSNWVSEIQVKFASYSTDEFEELRKRLNGYFDLIEMNYVKKGDLWVVHSVVKDEYYSKIKEFVAEAVLVD